MRKMLPSFGAGHGDNSDLTSPQEFLRLAVKKDERDATLQKPRRASRFFQGTTAITRAMESVSGLVIDDPIGTPFSMTFPIRLRTTGKMFACSGLYQGLEATARGLETNVMRPKPLRHAAFLQDTSLVALLEMSARYHDAVEAVLADQDGEHLIPVLADQCFDQPAESRTHEFSGVQQVTGFDIDKPMGGVVLLLNHGSVRASLTPEIAEEVRSLMVSELLKGVHIEGRWIRTDDGGWQTQPGARLVFQRELALADASEPEATR